MKKLKNYKLVAGLGETGMSCVKHYRQLDCPVMVTDSRESPPKLTALKSLWPEVPVSVGSLDERLLADADEIILSPGISSNEHFVQEAKRKNIPVIGDVEVFCRIASAPIIAITGSNAKSTVCTLVAQMIEDAGKKVSLGGNIGVPVLELLGNDTPDFYVLELSSFQLESLDSLKAKVACVLNISPDHMDRYANKSDYIAAKQVIYENAELVVVNKEDKVAQPHEKFKSGNIIGFTKNKPGAREFGVIHEGNVIYLAFENKKLMPVSELTIMGSHNYENALAALAIGYSIGLELELMLNSLKTFPGLTHRCEWLGEINKVNWINDSKGTNVGATEAAILGFSQDSVKSIVLILGGVCKGANFTSLIDPIKNNVRDVILFGEDGKLIGNTLGNIVKKHYCESLSETVDLAYKIAQAGETVLFSPACASFDMFKNFEDRGEQFSFLVKKLSRIK